MLKSGKILKLEGGPVLCGKVGVKNQEAVDVPTLAKPGEGRSGSAAGRRGAQSRSGLGSGLRAAGPEVSGRGGIS